MANEILSYLEMCQREHAQQLQRGMNFGSGGSYSVLLMSQRPNAPYSDQLQQDGTVLIYEGHDVPRTPGVDPKSCDQPAVTATGRPTENGKFFEAATLAKHGQRLPERVRVYEKIRSGIWSYNGLFELVDAWQEEQDGRLVFKFKLHAIPDGIEPTTGALVSIDRTRVIPTQVKLEVWKRDQGCCVVCGAEDELHFDHVLPYAKGGTSISAANVQLLCVRHNLSKGARIE